MGVGAGHSTEYEYLMTKLMPVDREALRVLYGHLKPGADPSEFGRWASTSMHIHGNGEHASFGVAWRNGYGEPWAYGYLPDTDLSANPALAGTVTWRGELLGFTPSIAPVAGDAMVTVNLDSLTGRAAFTNLESWTTTLGSPGTGAVWSDGDLRYGLAVSGNTFAQTDGDAGTLTGAFFGAGHEGMGGVLERPDLAAAFGGELFETD